MADLAERVAVLEAQRQADNQMLEAIHSELEAIHDDMTKYKGFLGGITFVMTCVGTFLAFGKDWLLGHWK